MAVKALSKNAKFWLLSAIILLGLAACSNPNIGAAVSPTSALLYADTTRLLTSGAEAIEPSTALPALSTQEAVLESDGTLESSLIQVYKEANPSVVYIINAASSGSGFVYSQDGFIVTNNHVVQGGRSFEVVFANGERQAARLVGSDADSDLAVIQVDTLPQGVQPLKFSAPDHLQVGQFVVAIGNPFGEQGSMSLGIVSGLGRSLPSQRETTSGSTYNLPEVIQTDAPINPGNSGGPLLNLNGEVVGVNAAIASETGTNTGVGFSIPVKAVRQIVPELIEAGRYEYPYMGASFDGEITLAEEDLYGLAQTAGIYVLAVAEGSPADRAGLKAADPGTGRGGDLVVAIDDQPVRSFSDLNRYLIFQTSIGQTIELTIMRNGEQMALSLTLSRRP